MIKREFMPFLPDYTIYICYIAFIIALAIHLYGLKILIKQIKLDNSRSFSTAFNWLKQKIRANGIHFINHIFLQKKTNKVAAGKYYHSPLFYGIIILTIGTALIGIEEDFLKAIFGLSFLKGTFYKIFEFALDTAGIALIVGVVLMIFRRLFIKPFFLPTTFVDYFLLLILLFIGASGFFLEAMRFTIKPENTTIAAWAGKTLSLLFETSEKSELLNLWYVPLWYFHMLLGMAFIAVIPYTKLRHILLIPFNYLANPPPKTDKKAKLDTPFNILDIDEEDENNEEIFANIGIGSTDDLNWKSRLQFLSCINCGRCENECPAYSAGRKLSPRNVIQKISKITLEEEQNFPIVNEVVTEEEMWGCTNCYACIEACPAFIRHVDHFLKMRRYIVNTEFEDESKISLLSNIERNGNPYGIPSYDRAKWKKENIPTVEDTDNASFLYFIGCSSSYNSRCQKIAEAVIGLLKKANIEFCVLGEQERCCGEPAKRIGEEGLFQMNAIENIELFNSYGVKTILTHCPHCFNMFKYEYPDFGAEFEVIHHSQLIRDLIKDKRIVFNALKKKEKISYHDPCNLGRLNKIYVEPREVIEDAGQFIELPRTREKAFCCGGGGGNVFYQVNEKKRISSIRIDEAIAEKIDILGTACPFCMIMFEDSVGNYNNENKPPEIRDIAEIVSSSIE